jgi:hypothetical protein
MFFLFQGHLLLLTVFLDDVWSFISKFFSYSFPFYLPPYLVLFIFFTTNHNRSSIIKIEELEKVSKMDLKRAVTFALILTELNLFLLVFRWMMVSRMYENDFINILSREVVFEVIHFANILLQTLPLILFLAVFRKQL